ncbi:MAG: glycosyltransferase [Clostridia bacterium]
MNEKKIISVVVTHNRKQLLLECIEALMRQTHELNNIIIIDNNSTDGTYDTLKANGYIENEKIIYNKLNENIGGAGGFHEGLKLARTLNPDWVWIMDDDTIPKEDSLEELVKATNIIGDKVGFLASSVYGMNYECMNVPNVNIDIGNNGYAEWYRYLKYGIIRIKEATFVSLLINGDVLEEVGLPCRDYFIWGDDIEYTLRINKYFGNAYMVGKSEVIHKRNGGRALSLKEEENKSRINMYYYMIRNNYINTKEYKSKKALIKYILDYNLHILSIIFSKSKYKLLKIKVILTGLYSAIFGRYDRKAFIERLKS